MKRNEILIPLSKEHHNALILAQVLKRNPHGYKGIPEPVEEKINYAMDFFRHHLLPHFREEEMLITRVQGCNEAVDDLCAAIIQEHAILKDMFGGLNSSEDTDAAMHASGELLEKHIRKEERQLFPLVEKYCLHKLV
ncbi:MAG: hemerythrin domain-containing protein [Bacteroidetes bacterium]|nr:hemerythrin domain-containing protein [Bacteroidota bacterium]